MSTREKLPYVDLKALKGLFTKTNSDLLEAEQLRVCENADFFDEYGSLSKLKGNRRVLSSIYTETGIVKPISWLEFYKQPDLDGQIIRHTLAANGTRISRLESDGTFTPLVTNRTEGLFATSDQLDRFLFITNVDPDHTGVGDTLLKYDGAVMSQWGLTPPGSQEIVEEDFFSNQKRLYDQYAGMFPSFEVFRKWFTILTEDFQSMVLINRGPTKNIMDKVLKFKASSPISFK